MCRDNRRGSGPATGTSRVALRKLLNPVAVRPMNHTSSRQKELRSRAAAVSHSAQGGQGRSYLCAPNYCLRYRPAARQPEMVDTGMNILASGA